MKLIGLLDRPAVVEKSRRDLNIWPEHAESPCLSRDPPHDGGKRLIEPFFDEPCPDYDTEPVDLSSEALA